MTIPLNRFVVTCCDWTRYEIVVDAQDAADAQAKAVAAWAQSGPDAFRGLTGSTDDFCVTRISTR